MQRNLKENTVIHIKAEQVWDSPIIPEGRIYKGYPYIPGRPEKYGRLLPA